MKHKEVVIEYKRNKYANVDEGIADLVKLLNSIPYLETYESCQGSTTHDAIIFFTVSPRNRTQEVCNYVFKTILDCGFPISSGLEFSNSACRCTKSRLIYNDYSPRAWVRFPSSSITLVTKHISNLLNKKAHCARNRIKREGD